MVAHALLLFRARRLELGRLVRRRGALRGRGGLRAMRRFPVAVMLVGFVLLVPSLLAVPVRIAPPLVPLGIAGLGQLRARGVGLMPLSGLGMGALGRVPAVAPLRAAAATMPSVRTRV